MKTFNEYQIWVRLKAGSERNERATYALGLAGESGEVCDLLKKHWGHRQPLDREKLKKELGDVLWYVGAIADQFGAIDRAGRGAIRFEDYERFLELRR